MGSRRDVARLAERSESGCKTAASPAGERRRTPEASGPTLRLLLAQDHPTDARLVCEHLDRDFGAQAVISRVASARDAAALVRERAFDVVLIDIALPDVQGVAGLKVFCDAEPRPPLIVLSGACDQHLAARAVSQGAQDYLSMDRLYPYVLRRMILHVIERHRYERRLREIARFDALTGLANRYALLERMDQAILRAGKTKAKFALLFLDVDRFKAVNDGFGHTTGDHLLCEVARRIEAVLRHRDCVALLSTTEPTTAARLGGDEFAVLLAGVAEVAAARRIAQRVSTALSRSLTVDGHEFAPSASVGVALYPDDGDNAEELLRAADTDMYRVKGRGRPSSYPTRDGGDGARAHVDLERDLRGALAREEFVLHFQPQVSLRSGDVIGVETLLRWRRKGEQLLMPDAFLGVLNDTGLIIDVGRWVLTAACERARAVGGEHRAVHVAVNVSPRQLENDELVGCVKRVLERTRLPPELLELEIVEDALLDLRAAKVVTQLAELGVRIALDDFGSGYSSFARLRDLPVHTLKLDRSFLSDVERSARAAELVRGVIGIAHRLQLRVVGEGVERDTQLRLLAEAGCEAAQGFLLGAPREELLAPVGPMP